MALLLQAREVESVLFVLFEPLCLTQIDLSSRRGEGQTLTDKDTGLTVQNHVQLPVTVSVRLH